MAKFRITDNQTGRSVVVSGDKPPTPQDAEAIFAEAGLRGSAQAKSATQQGSDVLRSLGAGILPNIAANAYDVGNTLLTGKRYQVANPQGYENPFRTADQLTEQFGGEAGTAGALAGAKQTAQDSAGLLSWLIPVGKGIKTAAGLGASAGGLQAVSQDDANPLSVLAGAGAGAVLGPAVNVAGKAAGAVTKKVGREVTEQGEQLVLRGLKPTKTQLTKFKEKTGKDLADWLTSKGITGNFAEEASARIEHLQTQFDDIAVRSGVKVPVGKVQQKFIAQIKEFGDSILPSVKGKAEDLQVVMDNLKAKYGDEIDVGDLTQERRLIDRFLKENQFGVPAEQANYLRSARDALQDAIQESTEKAGLGNLKQVGLELRDLYQFQKIAQTQGNLGRGTNILGLLGLLGGTTGGVVGGVPGAIAGVLGSAALRNPNVISAGSKAMRATGEGLQGASAARLEAMKRLLRNTGSGQAAERLP